MNTRSDLTNIQAWFRDHSDFLGISFKSSEAIKHNVTKGKSRERQIFDTLSKFLPTKISIEQDVIIIDSLDAQSLMFDGAFVDRIQWPRLSTVDGTPIALIESIQTAVEIKSSLNQDELNDIFNKSKSLRSMRCYMTAKPLVTAFAYECQNLNLSFFDYATFFNVNYEYSPSLICVLNKGLFGLMQTRGKKAEPVYEPHKYALPALYYTEDDTLLVYLYFLIHLTGMEASIAQIFTRYSDNLFDNIDCFYFEVDFLNAISSNIESKDIARKCFQYKPSADIKELYREARKAINLPIS